MKIGVLDSDGKFDHIYFQDKKINIISKKQYQLGGNNRAAPFSHGEYVCSHILKENPEAEVVLVPIINENMKCSVQDLIDGIYLLIEEHVDVINLSIGDEYKYHSAIEEACQAAYANGILIVAAHSNREVEATYPADFSYVLGVKCMNEVKPSKIMKYDSQKNEITFSTSYFSIYHLGIPKLISGNSFACARVTGIVSRHRMQYQDFLKKYQDSIFNEYYPYASLKEKRCLFFSNRPDELLEQRFITEITNTIKCLKVEDGLNCESMQKEIYDLFFIDHDCYMAALPLKKEIIEHSNKNPDMETVLRYPLFNIDERMTLYEDKKTIINQFYI